MGIKDKLLGKKNKFEEEEPTPDDFELEDAAKKAIKEVEDTDIDDFLRKKRNEIAEKENPKSVVKEEVVDVPVEEVPEEPLITEPTEEPGSIENPRQSNSSEILTMYLKQQDLAEIKEMIDVAVKNNFGIALQAGIQINKQNANEVKSLLKYLVEHNYLGVISAEKVELLFDGSKK